MTGYIVSRFLVAVPERFSQSPHGRSPVPTGVWDHIIVLASIVAVLVSVYLCIRFFLLPKEEDRDHIKHRILSDDVHAKTEDDHAG